MQQENNAPKKEPVFMLDAHYEDLPTKTCFVFKADFFPNKSKVIKPYEKRTNKTNRGYYICIPSFPLSEKMVRIIARKFGLWKPQVMHLSDVLERYPNLIERYGYLFDPFIVIKPKVFSHKVFLQLPLLEKLSSEIHEGDGYKLYTCPKHGEGCYLIVYINPERELASIYDITRENYVHDILKDLDLTEDSYKIIEERLGIRDISCFYSHRGLTFLIDTNKTKIEIPADMINYSKFRQLFCSRAGIDIGVLLKQGHFYAFWQYLYDKYNLREKLNNYYDRPEYVNIIRNFVVIKSTTNFTRDRRVFYENLRYAIFTLLVEEDKVKLNEVAIHLLIQSALKIYKQYLNDYIVKNILVKKLGFEVVKENDDTFYQRPLTEQEKEVVEGRMEEVITKEDIEKGLIDDEELIIRQMIVTFPEWKIAKVDTLVTKVLNKIQATEDCPLKNILPISLEKEIRRILEQMRKETR